MTHHVCSTEASHAHAAEKLSVDRNDDRAARHQHRADGGMQHDSPGPDDDGCLGRREARGAMARTALSDLCRSSPAHAMKEPASSIVVDLSAFDAFLFDLDGVITRTAGPHAAAWKQLFDGLLAARPIRTPPLQPAVMSIAPPREDLVHGATIGRDRLATHGGGTSGVAMEPEWSGGQSCGGETARGGGGC